MKTIDGLEERLGYRFRRRDLLEQALTHRSRANEAGLAALGDNERLEFLGDAILGFLISDLLYQTRPGLKEGELSKLKGFLVSAANLVRYAEQIELGDYLLLGRGEEKTGGRRKRALLVNAFEALIGALYLDGGIDPARKAIRAFCKSQVDDLAGTADRASNFKSELQEKLQAMGYKAARYRLIEEKGPDHRKLFTVEVLIGGQPVSRGIGMTKKAAEQAAAMHAIGTLKEDTPLAENNGGLL